MQNKKIWLGGLSTLFVIAAMWFSYSAINSMGWFKPKPNIVIVLTDDLDFSLMPYMENTNRLIAKEGATFTNYFVTSPLCCPSRASMFRGQYPHNTNILENSPGFMNYFRNGRETETIATWLNNKGYKTALEGKYLNGYPVGAGRNYVPPGWTDWHAFIYQTSEGTFYYDYKMNENGPIVQYGKSPQDYSTDVIKKQSINFIDQSIAEASPFFILISVSAPHGPSTPATRHADLFPGLVYPKKPSFDEKDTSDKPTVTYTAAAAGDEFDQYDADVLFRKRVQTVQAVDELVGDVIHLLEQKGKLENTYIIFTSDNGFHLGEHNIPSGKGYPYEEDIHVPFFIRGPGIQPNSQITQMSANIDIAPTVTEMAHVKSADFIDGRSLMPFLYPQVGVEIPWRKGLLMETGYMGQGTYPLVYRGVRTETFIYLEYENGELEYYDLVADPYELNNAAKTLDPATLASLHAWVDQLKKCRADECRTAEMAVPDNLKGTP